MWQGWRLTPPIPRGGLSPGSTGSAAQGQRLKLDMTPRLHPAPEGRLPAATCPESAQAGPCLWVLSPSPEMPGWQLEAAPGCGREENLVPKPGALCPVKVGGGIPVSDRRHQGGFLPRGVGVWGWRHGRQRMVRGFIYWRSLDTARGLRRPHPWAGDVRPLPTDPGWLGLPRPLPSPRSKTHGAVGSCLPRASILSLSLRPAAAPVGLMHGGWVCLQRALGWEGTQSHTRTPPPAPTPGVAD